MLFENELKLGNGIYTIRDISRILRLPYPKINRWLNKYWNGRLGKIFKQNYSWSVNNSKAVGFHTLVEFYVLMQLAEAGVSTRAVLKAHIELSNELETAFPFAQKEILKNIKTDGTKIYLYQGDNLLALDGTQQLNLVFVRDFFKKLDFDNDLLACRFWPLGKKKSILIDPKRQFGHPVVGDTNIYPETLFNLFKAGEPKRFIAFTYEIDEKKVDDAIEFCSAA